MKTTRRGLLAGALAVPTVAGLASWQWRHGGNAALLHDASLHAGQRFAAAGRNAGGRTIAIEGDTVRFAQSVLGERPSLIAGISLFAEALLIGEAAAEVGYMLATELRGDAQGCEGFTCNSGWLALNRMAIGAGPNWVEALAHWAVNPQASDLPSPRTISHRADPGKVLAWVLVPRG